MAKYRIMIIDDDEEARHMMSLTLDPCYEVVEAQDGLDALSKLEMCEPDLAIIDIMMPVMDGYQVCEAIRRHPKFNSMQVIFLSAYGSKENIRRAYASGSNLFMTKPVDPERVLKNIDFTIQHEPPPMRHKRYTVAELKALDQARKEGDALKSRQPARPTQPAQSPPQPSPAAQPSPPRAQQRPPNVSAAPPPAPPPQLPRILAVDDDKEMLKMLQLALHEQYEFTSATNGMDAIDRMVSYEPDLMLLDIMMPKMNGYQLLQSLRRNQFFRHLPVVVLSAKSTPKDREYAARLGASAFLAKPYGIEELMQTIGGIVQEPGFGVRFKKMSMPEISEQVYREQKDHDDREKQEFRRRRFAEMRDIIAEDSNDKT